MAVDSGSGSLITAKWRKIAEDEVLKRSSHSVAAIPGKEDAGGNEQLFIFGGELVARQPKDGHVHAINAAPASSSQNQPHTLNASPSSTPTSPTPTPRVGTSMTAVQNTLYIFSGRGGPSMTALDEAGGFWTLRPETATTEPQWSLLPPSSPSSPLPPARSYHSVTNDGTSQIFIHAGCAADGRLRDLWSFDVNERTWTQLPNAPGPSRGGTSLCFAEGKIWRFGGFDGKREIGGLIDCFDVDRGEWGDSVEFVADGVEGPRARSVAGFVPVYVGGGKRLVLIAIFGEADPSSLGHEGAGKMLGDVWAFDVEGRRWAKVDDTATTSQRPAPRGWFGAAAVGRGRLAVVGGLGEDNERLGDAWVLDFE